MREKWGCGEGFYGICQWGEGSDVTTARHIKRSPQHKRVRTRGKDCKENVAICAHLVFQYYIVNNGTYTGDGEDPDDQTQTHEPKSTHERDQPASLSPRGI
jgi:hypothetical protein